MALSIGDRLGRFEILGSVGAGGMGEVYRARDLELKRDVAIKVLPAEFSKDEDRRRRFEQEARAAGSLNHPNILAVYDVGREGDIAYLVTELLDGETLAVRMGGRPLPVRKAIDYAIHIAAGLAAAHDRGVVHRDIKPANVFVTSNGLVKILDFGLAKVVGPDPSGDAETVMSIGDEHSSVAGTVAYMSPEQARGNRVDHRTDIFTFGVVLYEMLTGVLPFRRGNIHETIEAILHDDPPEISRSDAAMPDLERIVRHCLEKKPEERFQHVRDLIFDLEGRRHDTAKAAPRQWGPRWQLAMIGVGAVVALLGAAAAGAFLQSRRTASMISLSPPHVFPLTDTVGLEEFPAISPDGKMVAFTAADGARRQVFIRFLSRGSAALLQVTNDEADHQQPRWSPDGASLIYFSPATPGAAQGTIHKIPALRGPSQRVIASIGGGDVSTTGRLACFRLEGEHIQLVTSTLEGSDVAVVASLPTMHHGYPRWSPDNRWIAFQTGDGLRWEIYVVPAGGGAPRKITNDRKTIAGLTWLPDSSAVIYATSRASTFPYLPPLSLWEARLDGQQRQLTSSEASYEQPDLQSGLLSVSRRRTQFEIWKYPFDANGVAAGSQRAQQLTHQTGQVSTPTASPTGDEVAYLSDNGGHANIWIAPATGPPRQITAEDDPEVAIGVPIWSPRDPWIAFVSSKGNTGLDFGIWLVKPDGSEQHRLVPKGLGAAWSEDGQWLYYVEGAASNNIKRIAVGGGDPQTVRVEAARNIIGVHASTLYFVSDRALMDGRQQVEIRAAPLDSGPSRVIATIEASRVPSWQVVNPSLSPDGKWLATMLTDGFTTNIWTISTDDGRMRQVTNFGDRAVFIARRVSWSPDGGSILAAIGEGDADIVLLDGLIKREGR
jgi:serine/threonine protein kinase/Tol biopolymer transport system component